MQNTYIATFAILVAAHLLQRPGSVAANEQPAFEPTEAYEDRVVNGWSIKLNRRLIQEEPRLCNDVMRELDHQLYLVTRVVPKPALEKIKTITIWVELFEKNTPCAAYHPDVKWLKEHDINPEKQRCVELANAHNFITWTHGQPWMLLHELAHGYHHQFLENGFRNAEVRDAFEKGTGDDRYGQVRHIRGGMRDHYAATNPMEYFAETSEAFFGVNDYFPFVRPELEQYDPHGLATIKKMWEIGLETKSDRPKDELPAAQD